MTDTETHDARADGAMVPTDDEQPTGALAWLTRCVAYETTARDVRNIRRWGLWMLAWAVVAIPDADWFGAVEDETSLVTVVQAVLVLGALSGLVWSYSVYIRQTDELNRSIQLRALGVGFAAGFLSTEIGQAAINAGLVDHVDVDIPALAMLVSFGIASILIQRRYR